MNEEAKKEGFILAYRSTMKNWLWQDKPFSKGQAWIDLLMNANYLPAKVMIEGQLIRVNRGEQCRSMLTLKDRWGWSRGKVKRFLDALEKDGMIVYKTSQLTTLISICNYNDFQNLSTSHDTTDGQRTDNGQDTNNNNNNKNNINNELSTNHPQAEVLALYIFQKLKNKDLLIKKNPNLQQWELDVTNLIQSENLEDWHEVIKVFDWSHNHDFWWNKILSPNGLKKNWQMLKKQMNQSLLLKLPEKGNLVEFAKEHSLPEPGPGMNEFQYRRKLQDWIKQNNYQGKK